MAAPKKATHEVIHPKQFLAVGGKLQHVKAGTQLALSEKQAEALEAKGRVRKLGDKKAVDLTADDGK